MSSSESYFVPGYGISRHVLQSNIGRFLGPNAFVRPYTHLGRDGFLVTAPNALTKSQIDDIVAMSRKWEEQAASKFSPEPDEAYINQPIPVSSSRESRRR